MRISDIVHGLVPEEEEPSETLPLVELDIDTFTVRALDSKGSTKRLHLWQGNEATLPLAEACLPKHTLKWYRDQLEIIDRALGNIDQKRDVLLIHAIQRGFGKSVDDSELDEDRVGRIV